MAPTPWILWNGRGRKPVAWPSNGQVRFRNGEVSDVGEISPLRWFYGPNLKPSDIVAYRIIPREPLKLHPSALAKAGVAK